MNDDEPLLVTCLLTRQRQEFSVLEINFFELSRAVSGANEESCFEFVLALG